MIGWRKIFANALTVAGVLVSLSPAVAQKAAPVSHTIDVNNLRQVASGIYVIEDKDYIPAVPNVTFIIGANAVLVVDTGLGPTSGRIALATAQRLAPGKRVILTITHFHPEHGFGAQVFKNRAMIIYDRAQRDELHEKGEKYIALFKSLGVGAELAGVHLVDPDIVYDTAADIDLGGRVVQLRYEGAAHTKGDQIITVPDAGVVILGDLLETNSFPIFPWYPELGDTDVDPLNWRAILRKVEEAHPTVVIPGHGPVGTVANVDALAAYLDQVQSQVSTACYTGMDLPSMETTIGPVLRSSHPDWRQSEWVQQNIEAYYVRTCAKAPT